MCMGNIHMHDKRGKKNNIVLNKSWFKKCKSLANTFNVKKKKGKFLKIVTILKGSS